MANKKKPKKPQPSKADRVRAALKKHPDKSPKEIAEMLGLHVRNVHSTIYTDRQKKRRESQPASLGDGVFGKLAELQQMWTEMKAAHALLGLRINQIEELIHG